MKRKRRLSQQDLRTLGVTPGLMVRRIGTDGRARLEQLTAETRPRPSFGAGLTKNTKASEESETA
jgi:hypothetical protein